YLIGVGGQYVADMLADRQDQRRLYFAWSALMLPALLLMSALAGLTSIGAAALFAFFTFGMPPIENRLFLRYVPPRRRAAAFGCKSALTVGVGALGVWLVQWA